MGNTRTYVIISAMHMKNIMMTKQYYYNMVCLIACFIPNIWFTKLNVLFEHQWHLIKRYVLAD